MMDAIFGLITPDVIDMGDCLDIFLCGLARVERLPGNNLRFVWYSIDRPNSPDERRIIKLKAIVPADIMPDAMMQIGEAIARPDERPIGAQSGMAAPLKGH